MSAFLKNMIERSTGASESIRPRVRSLFEPVPVPAISMMSNPDDDSRDEERSQRRESIHVVEHEIETRVPIRADDDLSARATLTTQKSEDESRSDAAVSRQSLESKPLPSIADPPISAERLKETATSHGFNPVPEAKLVPVPTLLPQAARILDEHQESAPKRARVYPAASIERQEAPQELTAKSLPPDQNNLSGPRIVRPVVAPLLTQPFADRPRGNAQERQTQRIDTHPEPTIHVTIGRVEVRATVQETPKKSQRTPSAVMPLDEYLRTRSGSKRA